MNLPQKPAAMSVGDSTALSPHYIETSLVERPLRTLKHGDAFAVTDSYGDFGVAGDGPEGIYFNDTRFLSRFVLSIEGMRPLLLSSVVQDDNVALSVDLANPDIHRNGEIWLARDTISIQRTKFLWHGACYERIGLRNFGETTLHVRVELAFAADFHDLFEVRGAERRKRGTLTHTIDKTGVEFRYVGLDDVTRTTRLRFLPLPLEVDANRAVFAFDLAPDAGSSLFVCVMCDHGSTSPQYDFGIAYRDRRRDIRATSQGIATIDSSNELFNEVCCRATADLYMLLTETPHGLYPYAGIPWYSTAFGRDGLVTAIFMLWVDTRIARGVLQVLAALQATETSAAADAQPGKILHETRRGEMALLGEVPFKLYYGSVDSTPLFVMLAGLYFERTGDLDTIKALWPNIKAALTWIDTYGDLDKDGFIEYARETEEGLANQGWKDSFDSIFHADGKLAVGPIALCEVQGYVFAAKHHAAALARLLGEDELAARLKAEAALLQTRFDAAFWCEDLGTYALALDGRKMPCRVRSSNAGHALFTGIATPERAARVAETLLRRDSFTGWGIRTISDGESRYNPISYHDGSIWPHDNAMIALGFGAYGRNREAGRIFEAMFDAAIHQDLRRLPELFCGFVRRRHRGPTAYPVACAPQAWASAAPFAFLSATLGMQINHAKQAIAFHTPWLPPFLDHVTIRDLRVGSAQIDLRFDRHDDDVTLKVLRRSGTLSVTIVK